MAGKGDMTDYMDAVNAARKARAPVAASLMLLSIVGLIVLFFIWASLSEIEVIARGQGQVVPSRETQFIQSLEGGILEELMVAEGERVDKGEILMRISDVAFTSEERGTEARLRSLHAQKARLEAEARGEELDMPEDIRAKSPEIAANERALYESRQQELDNAISSVKDKISKIRSRIQEEESTIDKETKNIELLKEELEITRRMVARQAMPRINQIQIERKLNTARGNLEAARKRRSALYAELRAARRELADKRDKFRSQALGELNKVETKLASLKESLRSLEDKVRRAELRSPVSGIVNKITVKSEGGVIEPAQKLVEIVPIGDDLKILARVRPEDIAFLEVGQKANVKITAYDPQRYGSLKGRLTRIGASSVKNEKGEIFFEIEVRTDKSYMGDAQNRLPITPGMVAHVDIITGKRTILEYLAKPFMQVSDRALKEQ